MRKIETSGLPDYQSAINGLLDRLSNLGSEIGSLKIALVCTRYNKEIVDYISTSISNELSKIGGKITCVVQVPGALELPLGIKKSVDYYGLDASIAVGCVLRGETYHFEIVANESAAGLMRVQLELGVPVINCILTCENVEQAQQRAKERPLECLVDCLEMIVISRELT